MKKSKHVSNSGKKTKKAFRGLGKYIVIGIISAAGVGIAVLFGVFNSVLNPVYTIVTLPNTGDVVVYARCKITENGVGTYAKDQVVLCSLVSGKTTGMNYESAKMYLACTPNDFIQMNVCASGVNK